jgi:hypothetical protein
MTLLQFVFEEINNPTKEKMKRQPMKKRPNVSSNAIFIYLDVKDPFKNDDV